MQQSVAGSIHSGLSRGGDYPLRAAVPGQPLEEVVGPALVTVGHRAAAVQVADAGGPGVQCLLGPGARGPGPSPLSVICLDRPVGARHPLRLCLCGPAVATQVIIIWVFRRFP